MVGVVEEVGPDVRNVKVGDRVTVNVETFCGECFFCISTHGLNFADLKIDGFPPDGVPKVINYKGIKYKVNFQD